MKKTADLYIRVDPETETAIQEARDTIKGKIKTGSVAEMNTDIDALIGSVQFPSEYDNPNYDPDYEILREAAYKDRGLL